MIKYPKRKCQIEKCNNYAIWGKSVQEHCEEHKEKNEINLIEKNCINCGLSNVLNDKNKCCYCDPTNIKKVRLAKQSKVKLFLDQNEFEYISCDKIIDGGACGKERPDFLFDCGDHFVILEIDENQHKNNNCECEQIRMINISQSLGLKTVFIRYNPDPFIVDNEKFNTTIGKRHKILEKWLRYLIDTTPKEFLSVIYLYFDDWSEKYAHLITILKTCK